MDLINDILSYLESLSPLGMANIALGLLASASFIILNYILGRNAILFWQSLGVTSVGIQFALLGVWGVTLVNAIFLIRNIIYYFNPGKVIDNHKQKVTASFLGIIVITYGILFIYDNVQVGDPLSLTLFLIPLFAAITNVLGVAANNILNLKIWFWLSTASWVVFNGILQNYQNLIGDIFSVLACTIAIIRILKAKKVKG